METESLAAALAAIRREFAVEDVATEESRLDVFRLRYQIYCLEHNFEAGSLGIESDEFDRRARHALIRRRADGSPVGTVRLVPPAGPRSGVRLPMERAGTFPHLRTLPMHRTAEISRFAISKTVTERDRPALLRLCLIRAVFMISGRMGLTHWCALMEPSLLRLLRGSSIHFHPVGTLVEHHGMRQPSWAGIADILDRVRAERPLVWDFISDGGTLWAPPAERERAVA